MVNASSGKSAEVEAGESIRVLGSGATARADVCLGVSGSEVALGSQSFIIPGGDGADPAGFLMFPGSPSASSSNERFSTASAGDSRLQLEFRGHRETSLAAGLISGATMKI